MLTEEQCLHLAAVANEVGEAYADCWSYKPSTRFDAEAWSAVAGRRNLEFLASRWLPRDEAQWVLEQYVKGYNAFTPALLQRFPDEAEIRIARERSVCLYVRLPSGCDKKLPTARRVSADEKGDTCLQSSSCTRYWWD